MKNWKTKHGSIGRVFVMMTLALCQYAHASPPKPSPEFQRAFQEHADRVNAGNKDTAQFVQDLQPIVAAGDPVAEFMLAVLVMNSDREKAVSLLRYSGESGCAGAAGALGTLLVKTDPIEGQRWIEVAAKGGDATSLLFKARDYERGEHGFAQSNSKAYVLAQLASRQAYNIGVKLVAEKYLERLKSTLNAADQEQAKLLLSELQSTYPKQPFYLCGQSTP